MVASGLFNEVPARDAVASLSHRRAANKCGAAILPFDSGTALGWKKTIVGSEAMARSAISTFCRAGLALQRQARRRCSEITTTRRARINDKTTPGTTAGPTSMASRRSAFCHLKGPPSSAPPHRAEMRVSGQSCRHTVGTAVLTSTRSPPLWPTSAAVPCGPSLAASPSPPAHDRSHPGRPGRRHSPCPRQARPRAVVVLGHAYGGFIARVLATARPEKVSAVILAAAEGRNVPPRRQLRPVPRRRSHPSRGGTTRRREAGVLWPRPRRHPVARRWSSQHDRKYRSARLQRTGPKGLILYRSAVPGIGVSGLSGGIRGPGSLPAAGERRRWPILAARCQRRVPRAQADVG